MLEEILIPKVEPISQGLSEIHFRGLGQIVAIAGPNGAGKSRLLEVMKRVFELDFNKSVANLTLERNLRDHYYEQNIRAGNKTIEAERDKEIRIRDWQIAIKRHLKPENSPRQHTIDFPTIPLKMMGIKDARQQDFTAARSLLEQPLEFKNPGSNATRIFQGLLTDYFRVRHPESITSKEHREKTETSFQKANELLHLLLGAEISWDEHWQATLFGRPLDEANLSSGQKKIFQFCASIFERTQLNEAWAIFMDEPETHLHPEAIIKIIEKLKDVLPTSQFWIATHSLPLLAHFAPSEIWYMENGRVTRGSDTSIHVLMGLMGGQENVEKLRDFLERPDELALHQFTLEALIAPKSVTAKADDPQLAQILQSLDEYGAVKSRPIRILDWGAGKGRLAAALAEKFGADATTQLTYYAYDISRNDKTECLQSMSLLGAHHEARHFDNETLLFDKLEKEKVDIIVMCNFLHEIAPIGWHVLLRNAAKLLELDGSILLVEDLLISKGELAYSEGFLLMDQASLGLLLNDPSCESFSTAESPHARYKERLVAYRIPRSAIQSIDRNSVTLAVQRIGERAKRQIEDLRRYPDGSSFAGRKHALALLQFANARLSLERLGVYS